MIQTALERIPINVRLTQQETHEIVQIARALAGSQTRTYLFGSRLDDQARGGDVYIMISLDKPVENPALLSATMAAKISRCMHGRKVDVIISAPNLLHLPIHEIAFSEGQLL